LALTYFDSSALLKLLQDEAGNDEAWAVWNTSEARLSSRSALPEVRAALAASHRNHSLSDTDLATAEVEWSALRRRLRPIELTPAVADGAEDLAGVHGLRGADAVHLASALTLGTDIVVVVWDRRLHTACRRSGLAVAPATLP
jgi:predicted nucleic acid-binding protein